MKRIFVICIPLVVTVLCLNLWMTAALSLKDLRKLPYIWPLGNFSLSAAYEWTAGLLPFL